MTKRTLHHTDILGALEFKKLKKGSIEWCDNNPHSRDKIIGENISKLMSNKNATYVAYMLGKPSGFLCTSCRREWMKIWREHSPIEHI